MTIEAHPVWPVLLLAGIQLVDAALCYKPVSFVQRCLDDVSCPLAVRPWLTPVKLAATGGLLVGLVFPPLGVLTCACLVAYFAIAVGMHIRARDIGGNLRNAAVLGTASGAVTLCFV